MTDWAKSLMCPPLFWLNSMFTIVDHNLNNYKIVSTIQNSIPNSLLLTIQLLGREKFMRGTPHLPLPNVEAKLTNLTIPSYWWFSNWKEKTVICKIANVRIASATACSRWLEKEIANDKITKDSVHCRLSSLLLASSHP